MPSAARRRFRPRPGLAHRCAIASLALTLSTLSPRPAMADGAVLFEAKCAPCHAGGGNVVARSKTLDRAALTANNVDIETIVTMGKNQMPGFGEACAPPACSFAPRTRLGCGHRGSIEWVDARADAGAGRQFVLLLPRLSPARCGEDRSRGLSRPLLERGSRHPVARGLESTAQDVDFGV